MYYDIAVPLFARTNDGREENVREVLEKEAGEAFDDRVRGGSRRGNDDENVRGKIM